MKFRVGSTLLEMLRLPIVAISIGAMMVLGCLHGGARLVWDMATSRPLRKAR